MYGNDTAQVKLRSVWTLVLIIQQACAVLLVCWPLASPAALMSVVVFPVVLQASLLFSLSQRPPFRCIIMYLLASIASEISSLAILGMKSFSWATTVCAICILVILLCFRGIANSDRLD